MRKMSMWLAMLAIIISMCVTQHVRADVQYMEVLTIGTSTTPAVGSSTVLANLEGKSYKYFRAVIQYLGVADMRCAITTGTASATNGMAVPNYGILVIDDLGDMKAWNACAGTTTTASYGTATLHYYQSHSAFSDIPPLIYKP